jgi:hypothetical protein
MPLPPYSRLQPDPELLAKLEAVEGVSSVVTVPTGGHYTTTVVRHGRPTHWSGLGVNTGIARALAAFCPSPVLVEELP